MAYLIKHVTRNNIEYSLGTVKEIVRENWQEAVILSVTYSALAWVTTKIVQ